MATEPGNHESAKADFVGAVATTCRGVGVSLEDEQVGLMWRHFQRVLETNRHTNLTRITEPAEAAAKHYADSLAVVPWARSVFPAGARVLDVGTGAGFPAVPLAICRPDYEVVAIDSTRKKAEVVAAVAVELGLANLTTRHIRAHELAGHIEPFDLVTFRAVDEPLGNLKESRRLVAPGGWLVCYATGQILDRLTEAQLKQAHRLGFEAPLRHDYRLILTGGAIHRVLAIWRRK